MGSLTYRNVIDLILTAKRGGEWNEAVWKRQHLGPQTVGPDEEANKLRNIASNVGTRLIPFPLSEAIGDMNCVNNSSSALHYNTGSCGV